MYRPGWRGATEVVALHLAPAAGGGFHFLVAEKEQKDTEVVEPLVEKTLDFRSDRLYAD